MKLKRVISFVLSQAIALSMIGAIPATAATTSEASFFAELNYDKYPQLADVKSAVDKKDYTTAKAELLEYYKERRVEKEMGFGISEADENYGMAVLPMRNILTGPYEFDMWQGEFTVSGEGVYTDYETDVTDRISAELNNGAVSFMLFAGDKQSNLVSVQSKEAGEAVAPRLSVTYDNGGGETTAVITASEDTYISSKNTSATYGTATSLNIKEDGTGSSSTGTETTRAYMTFPLDEAKNSTIISAKLIVSASQESGATGDTDILVINVGDTIWSEDQFTWAGTRGSIYSYENATVPTWNASAPNADSEYHNVTARFWFGKPMAYEYLSYLENPEKYNETHPYSDVYSGADFGPKLIDLMSAFASQMNHGWPRTLETGERLNRWVDIVDALLMADAFDGREDDFYKIITFMYGDCKYLNGLDIANGKYWWSNWRIVANAGFFKATEYLCELNMHDTFRAKAEYNVEYTMDLLYNDDMSFTEAGPSYAQWCAELFGDCAIMADKAGNPMSGDFLAKLKYATRYAANSFFPDGYDSNVGDSNYRDKMPKFKMLADFFDDSVLDAYVNGDSEYKGNLSAMYNESNSVYMRTGWNPQDSTYVSFVNNPGDGHYHPDSNQVLMYAYGQPLLVDSGRYSYSSTNKIYDELRSAAAHNTIEAVGVSMGAHSVAANKFSTWADNDLFSFAVATQNGYTNVDHTRNVLFFKKEGMYTLVTDYIKGTASNTYRQNWHFMPSSNATVDGNTINTNFYQKANISVANADDDATAQVRDGYFSADYGLVAKSNYASFEKTGTEVKFSTVLKPFKTGETVGVSATDSAVSNDSSEVDAGNMHFYVKNTEEATGTFATYSTDAKAAFVNDAEVMYGIVNGASLTSATKDYIVSSASLDSVGVEVKDGTVSIYGENLKANADKASAIKLYAPDATTVTLNGKEVDFSKDGDYIYAVGVTEGADETVVSADKDGFVKHDGTNEGTSNPTVIQSAVSGWAARNGYVAFDLTDYANIDFDKAVLRMNVTEVANSGKINFYWLDYGTWTRDTLSFVLDSTKMPTNTSSSGATYTGYENSFSGDVTGLAVGDVFEADMTSALKTYLASGNTKFTLAILAELKSGADQSSTKFASSGYGTLNGPQIVLSKSDDEADADVTSAVVSFTDDNGNEILDTETITTVKEGYLYSYTSAPETITTADGEYTLDKTKSTLTTVIEKGINRLNAVYQKSVMVNVKFKTDDVVEEENASAPVGAVYTYTPNDTYRFDNVLYTVDKEVSTLSITVGDENNEIVVYLKPAYELGENLITNGNFSNGTTDWTNALDGGQYSGTLSDNAEYVNGDGKALTNTASDGGSKASTLRRFVGVEAGKKYYLSFYAYNTGAVISDVAYMSAFVPVKGVSYGNFDNTTFKDYVAYGGQNSWSAESQSEVKRDRVDMKYDSGMNHKEYIITVPEGADNIMLSMFAWTDPGRLYFSDFELCEIEEVEPTLIFDGTIASAVNVSDDYTIIVAQYDNEGRLVKVEISENKSLEITKEEATVKSTAFIWDSFDTMKPILEKKEVTY